MLNRFVNVNGDGCARISGTGNSSRDTSPRLIASASTPAAGITPVISLTNAGRTAPAQAGPFLVDRREAARLLGVSPNTIANLVDRDQLPSVKILTRRLYDVDDLRNYIAARKTGGHRPLALAECSEETA